MICPMCNKEAYSFSNGDWYCPHCNNGVGSSRRVPIKQTTEYITNTNKDLAIECLKEVVKKLYDEFESGTFITDEGKEYYGSYVKYCLILDFVIDKLKALGLEGDDIFVDNILKELEEGK